MSGPAFPCTVWAVQRAVAIFDFQLHQRGIYESFTCRACEESAGSWRLSNRRARFIWWCGSEGLLPSGGSFVIKLRKGSLEGMQLVVVAVFARNIVVAIVEFDHRFEFLL